VPSIGAKNSVGYGGSPLVRTLRLAWPSAPPSGQVQGQGGGWRGGVHFRSRTRQRPHSPAWASAVFGCGQRLALGLAV